MFRISRLTNKYNNSWAGLAFSRINGVQVIKSHHPQSRPYIRHNRFCIVLHSISTQYWSTRGGPTRSKTVDEKEKVWSWWICTSRYGIVLSAPIIFDGVVCCSIFYYYSLLKYNWNSIIKFTLVHMF